MAFIDEFNKAQINKNRTSYSEDNKFADEQTLIADGVLQVGGADNVLDLGSQAEMWRNQVLNFAIAEVDDADGDETYAFVIEESDDSAHANIRKTTTVTIPSALASTTDDPILYPVEISPEYRYVRISIDVGGTTPSLKLLQGFYAPNIGN